MIKTYRLFFTPMCPNCPAVKDYMATFDNFKGELIDAATAEGMENARRYGVTSVPTVIFFNDKDEIVGMAHNIDEIKRMISNKSLADVELIK